MSILQLEDNEQSIDLIAFPGAWQEFKEFVKVGMACVIEGKLDDRGQIITDKIIPVDGLKSRGQRYVNVILNTHNFSPVSFVRALNGCKGKAKIVLDIRSENDRTFYCLNGLSVEPEKLNTALSAVMPAGSFEIAC